MPGEFTATGDIRLLNVGRTNVLRPAKFEVPVNAGPPSTDDDTVPKEPPKADVPVKGRMPAEVLSWDVKAEPNKPVGLENMFGDGVVVKAGVDATVVVGAVNPNDPARLVAAGADKGTAERFETSGACGVKATV